MKKFLLLFLTTIAFAQNPNHQIFLDHNWRLNFVQDGDNDPVYVHSSINYYRLEFSTNNFVTTICNAHFLDFSYVQNENKFEKLFSGSTLATCQGQNNSINNLDFYDFFVSNFTNGSSLNSHYPFVLNPIANNQYSLDIYNPAGKRLNFNSNGLSANSNKTISFNVFPNPVLDILKITSNTIINNLSLYNMKGQLVFESDTHFQQIDMTDFHSGIYFLKIVGENEEIINTKIVKN